MYNVVYVFCKYVPNVRVPLPYPQSRTPPLLDDSPLINRAPTVTSQNDSLEGMEIGTTSLSVEVEIFPRESRDSMGSFADESITEEAQLLPSESINSVEH